jgi:hypothetical protein
MILYSVELEVLEDRTTLRYWWENHELIYLTKRKSAKTGGNHIPLFRMEGMMPKAINCQLSRH